jgi:DNA-binding XRE family transcriptional regulator
MVNSSGNQVQPTALLWGTFDAQMRHGAVEQGRRTMGEAEQNGSRSGRVRLRQLRKQAGFTQETLADHLGVNRTTVRRWEAGLTPPTPRLRPSLADALRVSRNWISF